MHRIFFSLVLFSTLLFSDIKWAEDIDEAYEIAAKENKVVMVMLSRRGCPGCDYMKDIVFPKSDVSIELEKHFVSVHVDVREDFIPEGLSFFATPTFYFLNKDEKVLHRINGSENSIQFFEELKNINN